MKKILLILTTTLLLTACANTNDQDEKVDEKEVTQEEQKRTTKVQISKDYYRHLLPFEPTDTRGLTSSNMVSSYNAEHFEKGLLSISQKNFNPNDYLYSEGEVLNKDIIEGYLNPKYTKSEIKEMSDSEKEEKRAFANLGLNPSHKGEDDPEKIAENSPTYLAHILEQDFYIETDAKNNKLSGMTLGLAMNSVHYYQKEKDGPILSKNLDEDKVIKEGQKMAQEILNRIRVNDQVNDIPITFAIYVQSTDTSLSPGEFVKYAHVSKKSKKIGKWENVDQQFVTVPTNEAAKLDKNTNENYKRFNQDLKDFFPNYTTSIGLLEVKDGKAEELKIDIPMDYYGQSEVVALTQFVGDLLNKYFSSVPNIELIISDNQKPKATIIKEAGEEEPFIHIFE